MSNFQLLNDAPDFSVSSELVIEPLTPLSLVTRMPGKYYRSDDTPSLMMLYGIMENALGWHVSREHRAEILKALAKRLKTTVRNSNSGFQPLLQFHVQFEPIASRPAPMRYDDYWSQQLRGNSFIGGSREYSHEAIEMMNAAAEKRIKIEERATARRTGDLAPTDGESVHIEFLRPYFPHYYVSPTPREYIEVNGEWYRFQIRTSASIADALANAFADPVAPLYLGSNDGWVEATWKTL